MLVDKTLPDYSEILNDCYAIQYGVVAFRARAEFVRVRGVQNERDRLAAVLTFAPPEAVFDERPDAASYLFSLREYPFRSQVSSRPLKVSDKQYVSTAYGPRARV